MHQLSSIILKLRYVLLILFTAALVFFAYYIPSFKVDASSDTLLTKNNKLFIESQLINRQFSPNEFILLAYKPKNGELFTQTTFDDLSNLSKEFAQIQRVNAVTSILNVPLIESTEQLIGEVDVNTLTFEGQGYSYDKMRVLLQDHPIYTDLLINRAQSATATQIVFTKNKELEAIENQILDIQSNALKGELSTEQEQNIAALQAKAEPLKEKMTQVRQDEIAKINSIREQVSDRADTYLGGSYVVGQHLVDIIKSDLYSFGIAVFVMIAVLLLLIFRSLKWLVFPILICGVSITITLGMFAFFGMKATVISANFVALQVILSLALIMHLIACYRHIARSDSSLKQEARITKMLEEKFVPCFVAALTTSVGFASLLFSGIQPVIDFGMMLMIAMLITTATGLLLFPALLSFLPANEESKEYVFLSRMLDGVRRFVVKRDRLIPVVSCVIFVALGVGISRLNVENSFIDYFANDTEIHKELAFIDQEFGGSTPLDIILSLSKSEQKTDLVLSANSVNQTHLAHSVIDAFDATGNVTSLVSFTTLAKQINDNKPITEYELDVIYTLLDEAVVEQLLGAYLHEESQQLRISTRIEDTLPALNREQLMQNLRADLQNAGFTAEQFQFANLFVLYQDMLSRLFDSQIKTLGIVYAALGLVMLAVFRSFKVALVALIPNVLTTMGILGLIGWLNIPLDLMTITIAVIAMGIAVDDTIHFTSAFLRDKDQQNLQYTFSHTSLAMLITSFLIAMGFGMFLYSDFLPSVYFGLLTASAMLLALAVDFTLLPSLLRRYCAR